MIEKVVNAKDSQALIVMMNKYAGRDYEDVIHDAIKGFVAQRVLGLVVDKKGYKSIQGRREHDFPGDGTHFEAWDTRMLFGGDRKSPKLSIQLNLYYFFEGGDEIRKLPVMYFNPHRITPKQKDIEQDLVSLRLSVQSRQMNGEYRLSEPDRIRFENHPATCEREVARIMEYLGSPVVNP